MEKIYEENLETVMGTINDMIELQKGKLVVSDTPHGKISYQTKLYGVSYIFDLIVTHDNGGCRVRIETQGGFGDPEKRVKQLFLLMESMLH